MAPRFVDQGQYSGNGRDWRWDQSTGSWYASPEITAESPRPRHQPEPKTITVTVRNGDQLLDIVLGGRVPVIRKSKS